MSLSIYLTCFTIKSKLHLQHEPKYLTVDRIIVEHNQQKEIIASLRNDIEEKDTIIEDLKDTSTRQWNRLQQLTSNVQ
jgi:hypothetical protein